MDNIDFLTENLRELEKLRYELDVYKQSCPICGNRYYNDPSIVTKLEKEGEELRKAGQVAFNAFDERYDGAPDSGMTWMVEPMLALQKALQTGGR